MTTKTPFGVPTDHHVPSEHHGTALPAGRFPLQKPDSLAQEALASSAIFDLRELSVQRQGESLLISGRVNCFYHKQLAQETVRPHAANLRVVNEVSVVR
ncbi:BON domain-containing protein [Planctomycetaceae bacterium SH139]